MLLRERRSKETASYRATWLYSRENPSTVDVENKCIRPPMRFAPCRIRTVQRTTWFRTLLLNFKTDFLLSICEYPGGDANNPSNLSVQIADF